MTRYSLICLAALATACAPQQPLALTEFEESELSQALRGRTAGPSVDCVPQRNLRGNRSVGEGAILFEGTGGTVYVNRPAAGCPAITSSRALITRTPSGRLCEGDIVSVVDPVANFSFGSCGLGKFTPYRRVR